MYIVKVPLLAVGMCIISRLPVVLGREQTREPLPSNALTQSVRCPYMGTESNTLFRLYWVSCDKMEETCSRGLYRGGYNTLVSCSQTISLASQTISLASQIISLASQTLHPLCVESKVWSNSYSSLCRI